MRQQLDHSRSMELMSEHLRGSTARSLDLLRKIDGTIDALIMTRKEMDALREAFEGLLRSLEDAVAPLCEKTTIPALEQSQESLKALYVDLTQRCVAARRAPELRPDDGVVEAYEEVIESVAALNQEIETVRWAILEHNADLESPQQAKVFSNPKDIADFLDAL